MTTIWLVGLFFLNYCFYAECDKPVAPYEAAFHYQEKYELPELPYSYDALEPFIDERTMKIHHTGHHATYTKRLNFVLNAWRESGEEKELASKSLIEMFKQIDKVPLKYHHDFVAFSGGYFNHALFWSTMSPNPTNKTREPGKITKYLIKNTFETTERLRKWVKHEASNIVGSGYLYVCVDPKQPHHLTLHSFHNHDTPFNRDMYPILLVDVWEHAYYLKYQNDRDAYLDNWWRVVNWEAVETLIDRWGYNNVHDEL